MSSTFFSLRKYPDNKVHGANMGPTWVLSAPDGPHVGPMNLAIWVVKCVWLLWTPEYASGGAGGGVINNFLCSVIFPNFPNDHNSAYLHDIKFIFGRCHRSHAAETPGKYEHDWRYVAYAFAKSKFPVTEKLTNGALVTPTPGMHAAGHHKHGMCKMTIKVL